MGSPLQTRDLQVLRTRRGLGLPAARTASGQETKRLELDLTCMRSLMSVGLGGQKGEANELIYLCARPADMDHGGEGPAVGVEAGRRVERGGGEGCSQ